MNDDTEVVDAEPLKPPKKTFLVFEGIETGDGRGRHLLQFNAPPMLIKATGEEAAAMKWMRKTKRLSVYAVIPTTVIDFTVSDDDDDDDDDDLYVPRMLTP